MINRRLFLTVLEAEKAKVRVLAGLGSGEGPLSGCCPSAVTTHGGRDKGQFSGLLNKAVNPPVKALCPNCPRRPRLPPPHWAADFPHVNFAGTETSRDSGCLHRGLQGPDSGQV